MDQQKLQAIIDWPTLSLRRDVQPPQASHLGQRKRRFLSLTSSPHHQQRTSSTPTGSQTQGTRLALFRLRGIWDQRALLDFIQGHHGLPVLGCQVSAISWGGGGGYCQGPVFVHINFLFFWGGFRYYPSSFHLYQQILHVWHMTGCQGPCSVKCLSVRVIQCFLFLL